MQTRAMKPGKVDSHYVSRIDGVEVTVRTINRVYETTYQIYHGGWRVRTYATKASVRRYIMDYDCFPMRSEK